MVLRGCLLGFVGAVLFPALVWAQPIVIGFSAPDSGPAAAPALWQAWGIEIALDEINQAGGLLGRRLEILKFDNRCNPSEAVNVANRLIEAKVAAIIGAHCSSATLATMPLIAQGRIPMVEGVATSPKITEQSGVGGNDWMFRINPSDQFMMEALVRYLKDQTPFKKLAIVAEDTDFGRGGAQALESVAAGQGLSILSTDYYLQNQPDFTTILIRIQRTRPDAIALFQLAGDQVNLLRNAMQLGLRLPYTGRAELGGKNTSLIEAGGMEGSVSDWSYSFQVDTPRNRAFVATMQARHQTLPVNQAWAGYDAMRLLGQAIGEAGSAEPAKIRDALKHTRFVTLLGKTVSFDDHNQAGKVAVIQKVEHRQVKVVDVLELD